MAKIDYDDIEMSLYQVRVIAVNGNYDSDNYDTLMKQIKSVIAADSNSK